jgi:hypothetical protein
VENVACAVERKLILVARLLVRDDSKGSIGDAGNPKVIGSKLVLTQVGILTGREVGCRPRLASLNPRRAQMRRTGEGGKRSLSIACRKQPDFEGIHRREE